MMELGELAVCAAKRSAGVAQPLPGAASVPGQERTEAGINIPVKAPKKPRRVEQRTVLVIRDSEHAAVTQAPEEGTAGRTV